MIAPHQFHIPVMGLAYTVDTPLKVARYGIDSVLSIVEDRLIELMRRHYYPQSGREYIPINSNEPDYRARRITDYLNLVQTLVHEQVAAIKAQDFAPGSELTKYFELLPSSSPLRKAYLDMLAATDADKKGAQAQWLRQQVVPGSIDVNIMTKVDKNNFDAAGQLIENGSDALASLRGYVASNLTHSSIVFSAGLNPRLYNYLESFRELDAQGWGQFNKKIVIKVSDYRSALIQGKYLAKKGVWVSEFRIESGLNCGGHAFATDGFLLGPILQDFAAKKEELASALWSLYQPAVQARGGIVYDKPHPIRYTVQGGIGTASEAEFLLAHYGMESTGWGTPFLLCPEATTVDAETLGQLCQAKEEDVVLSNNSPLGVRFHYLKGTSGEQEKQARVFTGKPGSPCTEKHLVSNTEFTTEPICSASLKYQQLKLKQLDAADIAAAEKEQQKEALFSKECLCVGLINAAIKSYQLPALKRQEGVTVCPGPNIAYFNRKVTLLEMADHIYGRTNILPDGNRPHMFIKELQLYLAFLREQLNGSPLTKQQQAFVRNLQEGIAYYKNILPQMKFSEQEFEAFNNGLSEGINEIEEMVGYKEAIATTA
ncbi:hypothetical protein SAMN05444008_11958 [Cnuella takakiae]|uniref:Uncharacterized protein n=1 Tax=Cnuella takakiae TaxID=1302690 RepID=A0A1M5HHF2_9BACT|nr:hypothetical protein [Cnuella takakiae]OLY92872.1 hypothetical protein BUE76_13985 [Cnuella takakiae]SHG15399.1 hypothetical protein SAMN05444008_11958 [Cnuella takakiae]